MAFLLDLMNQSAQAQLDNETVPNCAWCGGECDQPRPYANWRGEIFCSPSHRSSSNRALARLTGGEESAPPRTRRGSRVGGSRAARSASWTGEVRKALADTRLTAALLDRKDIPAKVRNALKVIDFKVGKGPYGSSVFISSDRGHWDTIDENRTLVKAWCDAVDAGDASPSEKAKDAVEAWARRAALRG